MKNLTIVFLILIQGISLFSYDIQFEKSFKVENKSSFGIDNEGNQLAEYMRKIAPDSFKNYNNDSYLNLETYLYFGEWISFSFNPVVNFKLNEDSSLEIKDLSANLLLFSGYVSLEVGKFLPTYGVGYTTKNPTDFIYQETNNNSSYMVNTTYYGDYFTLEGIYLPKSERIPDLYSDKNKIENDTLFGRLSTEIDIHTFNFIYMNNGFNNFGLSYSTQVGDTLIPYIEVVYRDQTRTHVFNELEEDTFNILTGVSWSPYFMDFTLYSEFLYNGQGMDKKKWDKLDKNLNEAGSNPMIKGRYFPSVFQNIDFMNSSQFYFINHLEQSDSEKFFDVVKFDSTIITTFPLGFYGLFEMKIEMLEYFKLELNVAGVIYSEKDSELSYMEDRIVFGITISCSY